MIETLYETPFFVRRHREGLFGPHIDPFSESLAAKGYAARTIRVALRSVRAFGDWLSKRGRAVGDVDEQLAARFVSQAKHGRSQRVQFRSSVSHMISFLREQGVIAPVQPPPPDLEVVVEFRDWMREHRGLKVATIEFYLPLVRDLLHHLGNGLARLTARRLRAFVLACAERHGRTRAGNAVTACRMFLRFLAASGKCDPRLVAAVPTVASWRETSVPRHLPSSDVERVIASCDVTTTSGLRDRAVLLLLARLGLRAGDVAALTLDAIDWRNARLRVAGKGRREDWLPLPQDAGDAVLAYLNNAPPRVRNHGVFLKVTAPLVPISRWVVSSRRGIFVLDGRSMAVTSAMALRMLGAWLSVGDVLRILAGRGRLAMVMATGGHFASAVAGERLRKKRGERVEILSVHSPLPELVARLNEFQPVLLAPYASVAALLASEQEAGRLHINPVLISVTAEGLPTSEIKRIARAFNAKVGNSYAATECPFFSYSCEHEWLHVNSDWVVFEPVDADHRPVPPGQTSHTVLVSNLANRVQPILRYDLGDSILARPDPCPCGDPLPAIRVQGRASDVLTFPTPSGDKVRIAPLAFGTLLDQVRGVEMSQIMQTTPMTLRVRLRLAASVDPDQVWPSVQNALTRLLSEQKLQGVTVERAVEPPQQSTGGKYREVIPLGEASSEHERKKP